MGGRGDIAPLATLLAITLYNIENYVTNSVKKGISKNYVTNSVKKINNIHNINNIPGCFTNSLRKYEKDLLQNIMYWKRFLAAQRCILIVPSV